MYQPRSAWAFILGWIAACPGATMQAQSLIRLQDINNAYDVLIVWHTNRIVAQVLHVGITSVRFNQKRRRRIDAI